MRDGLGDPFLSHPLHPPRTAPGRDVVCVGVDMYTKTDFARPPLDEALDSHTCCTNTYH